MGLYSKALSFLALTSVAVTALGQEGSSRVEPDKAQIDALLKALVNSSKAWAASFTPTRSDCHFNDSECPAKVFPQPLFDSSGKKVACGVQVDEVDVNPVPGVMPKVGGMPVHWVIDTSQLPKPAPTYTFELTAGLVVLSYDGTTKIEKATVSNHGNDMKMAIHYEKGKQIIYYPLVYETVNGKTSLCAAFDPKIVNN